MGAALQPYRDTRPLLQGARKPDFQVYPHIVGAALCRDRGAKRPERRLLTGLPLLQQQVAETCPGQLLLRPGQLLAVAERAH